LVVLVALVGMAAGSVAAVRMAVLVEPVEEKVEEV
jgi:hypothetical protein